MKKSKPKVALFLGNDIVSHLIVTEVLHTYAKDAEFFIYKPIDHVNFKSKHVELKKLSLFERLLPNLSVFPLLDRLDANFRHIMGPSQINQKFDIPIVEIDDINAPKFIEHIKALHIDLGISVRSPQKFKTELLDYFSQDKRMLVKLHPGLLPNYRGLLPTFRAMMNGDKQSGYTLHKIDANWDTGAIIETSTFDLDYEKSAFHNLASNYLAGTALVETFLMKYCFGEKITWQDQVIADGKYYSFPNEEELKTAREKRIKIVDSKQDLKFFTKLFGDLHFYRVWLKKHILSLGKDQGLVTENNEFVSLTVDVKTTP